jgi:ATP-dependent DNA ligase
VPSLSDCGVAESARPRIIAANVNIGFCKPMECLPARNLPRGEHWTYEIKLDGFRIEATRTHDRVVLYSKQGKHLTSQFMQIALELEELPPRDHPRW